MTIVIPVGSPAVGKDFIDREEEIKQILQHLEKDHILLVAPRRFGKTSIMRRLEKELSNKGICIFLEVEDVSSPQEFLTEMIMGLIENEKIDSRLRITSVFKRVFSWLKENIEELETPIVKAKLRSNIKKDLGENWIEKANQISDIIAGLDSKIFFIIDEFSEAIKNMKPPSEAEKFLHWLRKIRQSSDKLRFIIGGSVSIDRVIRDRGGVKLINDFKRINIEGFKRDVALKFIEDVFNDDGWRYNPKFGEKILECIGEPYIPFFIAIMLSGIKDEIDIRGGNINEEFIEKIYNHRILGPEGKHFFDHYYQRLKLYYSETEAKAARAILRKLCTVDYYRVDYAFEIFNQETGINDYEEFMDLIADMCHDFYIELKNEQLRFYSKMLKDWWRLYHGNFG